MLNVIFYPQKAHKSMEGWPAWCSGECCLTVTSKIYIYRSVPQSRWNGVLKMLLAPPPLSQTQEFSIVGSLCEREINSVLAFRLPGLIIGLDGSVISDSYHNP